MDLQLWQDGKRFCMVSVFDDWPLDAMAQEARRLIRRNNEEPRSWWKKLMSSKSQLPTSE